MIFVQLTNGFGNNLFQYNAARVLAEFHKKEVVAIPPSSDYYGIENVKSVTILITLIFSTQSILTQTYSSRDTLRITDITSICETRSKAGSHQSPRERIMI